MRHTLGCLLLLASSAGAQRPDFSGTWVLVADSATTRPSVATVGDAAFRVGDMGSGWGSPLNITQRKDSLIVEYVFFAPYDLQPPVRLAYRLEGESRNAVMIGHASSERMSVVRWDDDSALRIIELFPTPPGIARSPGSDPGTVTRILRLLTPTKLEVRTIRGGARAATPTPETTTYTKR